MGGTGLSAQTVSAACLFGNIDTATARLFATVLPVVHPAPAAMDRLDRPLGFLAASAPYGWW